MWAAFLSWLTGGVLDRILKSVDSAIDNETQRQEIRGRVIQRYVETEAETRQVAMQQRMFWRIWALFAIPVGVWFAAIMADTTLPPFGSWGIPMVPDAIKPYVDSIFYSIFGSGGVVGAAQAIGSAIRGRR